MKKIVLLNIIILLGLFVSCKKDKKDNSEAEDNFSNSQVFLGNTSKITEVSGKLSENSIPDFGWYDEKDKKINLLQYKGKPIVINFWATWCKPCINEIPAMVRIYNQYKDRGVVFLGISVDQNITLEELAKFIGDNQINYQIVLDNGMLGGAFGDISAIPATFFIDKSFKVVESVTGAMDETILKSKVEKIL
jgi:peroxiredoxin